MSYQINTIDVGVLPGYDEYYYDVGDRTYVEDPEFFGKDLDGKPIPGKVIISEIVEHLDEPDKNSIKVQTYKNEF